MAADVHASHPTMLCVEHIETTASVASLVVGAYGTGGLFLHCGTSEPAWHTLLYVPQSLMAGISSQMVANSVNGSQYTLFDSEALHAVCNEHPTMLGMSTHRAARSVSVTDSGTVYDAHAIDVGSVMHASVFSVAIGCPCASVRLNARTKRRETVRSRPAEAGCP